MAVTCAASLLICAATCALWLRSHAVADEVTLLVNGRGYYLESTAGTLTYFAANTPVSRQGRVWAHARSAYPALRRADMDAIDRRIAAREHTGFRVANLAFRYAPPRVPEGRGPTVAVMAPMWLFAAPFAVPPMLWLRARRRSKGPGQCPACGYDLRASPDRCPECGKVVAG